MGRGRCLKNCPNSLQFTMHWIQDGMFLHVIFEVSLAHCLCYAQNLSYLTEGLYSGIKRAVHASCLAWLIDDFVFSQLRSLLVWLLISSYDSTLFFPLHIREKWGVIFILLLVFCWNIIHSSAYLEWGWVNKYQLWGTLGGSRKFFPSLLYPKATFMHHG